MRAVRKKIQLENMFFFARPGLSEFHKISVQKKKSDFFSKPSFSEFREKIFSAAATHAKPSPLQPRQRERLRRKTSLKARFL